MGSLFYFLEYQANLAGAVPIAIGMQSVTKKSKFV